MGLTRVCATALRFTGNRRAVAKRELGQLAVVGAVAHLPVCPSPQNSPISGEWSKVGISTQGDDVDPVGGFTRRSPSPPSRRPCSTVPVARSNARKRAEQAATAKPAATVILLSGTASVAEAADGGGPRRRAQRRRSLLESSPMLTPVSRTRMESLVKGAGPTWWTTAVAAKHASLAIDAARAHDKDLPLTATLHKSSGSSRSRQRHRGHRRDRPALPVASTGE